MKKFPIIDLHPIIQGEGAFMGSPMLMIRVSGCNLYCMFENSICDTPYSSFTPEKAKFTLEDVDEMIKRYPQIRQLSLSGGEPGLYPELISYLKDTYPDHFLLVETNGTVILSPETASKVDFASISPKLSSSVPTEDKCSKMGIKYTPKMQAHDILRFSLEALMSWVLEAQDFQLKYVVNGEEDLYEIKEHILTMSIADYVTGRPKEEQRRILMQIEKEQDLPKDFESRISNSSIYLMPAGITKEQLEEKRAWLMDTCIKLGFNYSDRLHIVAFGNERER